MQKLKRFLRITALVIIGLWGAYVAIVVFFEDWVNKLGFGPAIVFGILCLLGLIFMIITSR
jgi:uncharacterized membrane protein (DUF485 family)